MVTRLLFRSVSISLTDGKEIAMSRPRRWWANVCAARDEACLAVDLYNRSGVPRAFEGFVVHMHLAWLYLLQAEMMRDGVDYRYRRGLHRIQYVDGEPKRWDLARSVTHRFPTSDPVRENLTFFIALRNKIEHRYSAHQQALVLAVGGHAQALLINFDRELVDQFGAEHTLAARLRFPIFVGTFSDSGEASLRALRACLPKALQTFLSTYHAALDPAVADDQRFAFRLRLIPELSPRSDDALAVTYTRLEDLDPAALDALLIAGRSGQVIVREQQRPVANYGRMKPGEAAKQVEEGVPYVFKLQPHFLAAYRTLSVRPLGKDPHPERTREQFCIYDSVHRDYTYTPAYVAYLRRKLATAEEFRRITGCEPQLKQQRTVSNGAGL